MSPEDHRSAYDVDQTTSEDFKTWPKERLTTSEVERNFSEKERGFLEVLIPLDPLNGF